MSLRPPNLDNRRFDQLVDDARRRIAQHCPEWTDLSPGDPGMVLLEAFAYLTETMIFRLNRLPEKAYIEFLRLIGVHLQPPAAAAGVLRFRLGRAQNHPVEIPRGTRVTAGRSDGAEPPLFTTVDTVTIATGDTEVEVLARQCELVDAEWVGMGTGMPGLVVNIAHPPIIAPTGDGLDLVVGVETDPKALEASAPARQYEGKAYRIWREVENFSSLGGDRLVYVSDRLAGTITFAPAARMRSAEGVLQGMPEALAEVPPADSEIRVWYRRGGGIEGNVTANVLTTLKDSLPGVEVTNPGQMTGGSAAESLENALVRGPQELHSLHRAVTARDFELVAIRSSGAVERATAFTKAALWVHAPPGTVEVLLVPLIPEEQRGEGWITADILAAHATEVTREQIQEALDRRKPLGITCLVNWARYKTVQVKAEVIVHREEDPDAVKQRVMRRLWQTINPLSAPPDIKGWAFGQALTAWDIYKIVSGEPSVKSVGNVRMVVDEVPGADVKTLCADGFQPHTWYVATGDTVFRSMDDAQGWEAIGRFPGEQVVRVLAFPRIASTHSRQAGLVAVATELTEEDGAGSRLHISRDCGETWESGLQTTFRVEDIAWLERDGVALLLLATEKGLYELATLTGADPHQVLVDAGNPSLGFYAVAVSMDVWGGTSVAVAARGDRGVYLSSQGGQPETFSAIGLENELVRVLAIQHFGAQRYLWAGVAAVGNEPGKGCFRWLLTGSAENPEGWRAFQSGWDAGGCRAIAFQGSKVLAGSLRFGVLRLDIADREPKWEAPDINCKLPLRDRHSLQPVDVVATDSSGERLLAAGIAGVYRSCDQGKTYEHVSESEFRELVTLPRTWLFCSGEHEINVVSEDEKQRD
jgi:hypothetical protein